MFLPATDADIPRIVELMNRAYRGVGGGAASWSAEQAYIAGNRTTEALLREDIAANPAAALLKWVEAPGGPACGCVWLEPLEDHAKGTWYLGSLCVDPDRQNGGEGRTLLAAAEAWARERGAARVRMSVINVRDTLIAWYVRRGYVPTGENAPFPYGDDRFGTPLRDDLAFVVLEKSLPGE
jgi:ribosomal protein S18 acetylase RimI-like enzyme